MTSPTRRRTTRNGIGYAALALAMLAVPGAAVAGGGSAVNGVIAALAGAGAGGATLWALSRRRGAESTEE